MFKIGDKVIWNGDPVNSNITLGFITLDKEYVVSSVDGNILNIEESNCGYAATCGYCLTVWRLSTPQINWFELNKEFSV